MWISKKIVAYLTWRSWEERRELDSSWKFALYHPRPFCWIVCVRFFFSAIHKCILINILFSGTFTRSPISIQPRSLRCCHWWPVFICLCQPDFLPVAHSEPSFPVFPISTGCSWFHSRCTSFSLSFKWLWNELFSAVATSSLSPCTHAHSCVFSSSFFMRSSTHASSSSPPGVVRSVGVVVLVLLIPSAVVIYFIFFKKPNIKSKQHPGKELAHWQICRRAGKPDCCLHDSGLCLTSQIYFWVVK